MNINRRQLDAWLSAAPLTLALSSGAFAQGTKTLKILVGYAPGGAADVVARAVGEGLRSSGYTVIVENKAGAGGRLAIESLLCLPPDGTNLLIAPLSNLTIYPHIYRSLRYDPLKDLAPVGTASGMSFGIAVGASSPAKTLQEYLALARKDSAMAAYGTPGAGTPMHILGVMLGRESEGATDASGIEQGRIRAPGNDAGSAGQAGPRRIRSLGQGREVHRLHARGMNGINPIGLLSVEQQRNHTVSRRNAIVIMSDEHDPRIMGCAGHPIVKTPHLDALAARGVRFPSAYTPSPICVPARAAFATGMRVHQTRRSRWISAEPPVTSGMY